MSETINILAESFCLFDFFGIFSGKTLPCDYVNNFILFCLGLFYISWIVIGFIVYLDYEKCRSESIGKMGLLKCFQDVKTGFESFGAAA